jgi:hypothetical protein
MRTVCGAARRVQLLLRRGHTPDTGRAVRPLTGGIRPLLSDRIGDQRRGGAVLDQVDGTTCGSAVLVALAAWADPAELDRLDGVPAASAVVGAKAGIVAGFGARYDERQRQVHRESTRFWPRALGTTPWGMVGWLRRNVAVAGPYRVRLVDDRSTADLDVVLDAVDLALAAGRPVPLLVGSWLPRHYCLALGRQDGAAGRGREWRVYEPTSGQVRAMDPGLARRRCLRPVLGFDRLHAVLLPV